MKRFRFLSKDDLKVLDGIFEAGGETETAVTNFGAELYNKGITKGVFTAAGGLLLGGFAAMGIDLIKSRKRR